MVWTEGGEARMRVPTLVDVLEARRRIAPYLLPTPLHSYPVLDRLLGAEVWVKHENHQPIGAFKVRGGINLVSRLDDGERERGVITASTGNHGQSIAYASRLFGVRAIVCVPEGATPVKFESTRALARVGALRHADDRAHAEQARGVGDRLAVVAGRGGDHPALALAVVQPGHQVDATADLERPDRLVVLVLDPHLRPEQPVQHRIGMERRRQQIGRNAAASLQYVHQRRNPHSRFTSLGPDHSSPRWPSTAGPLRRS